MADPVDAASLRVRRATRRLIRASIAAFLIAILVGGAGLEVWSGRPTVAGSTRNSVTILAGAPATLDPAAQGDVATAAVTAQIFESVTAFDSGLVLRPALAASWDVSDAGRRLVFHLRPGLTFSDGRPLAAADVVRSWLRVLDPASPSPLASLLDDVVGAAAFRRGATTDPSSVGLHASGGDVIVDLLEPAADFPAIVASPTFGVVPRGGTIDGSIGSGGYVVSATTPTELTLTANPHYWAGAPAIATVHLLTTLNGASPVDAFNAGTVDLTPIDDTDAAWIAYDATLGPDLRSVPSLSVEYLGFDVRQRPFDDVRVRRAISLAVDWSRLVDLASTGSSVPASQIVPPGIPGRPATPATTSADPATARSLLAAAGYPGGAGFPSVTYLSAGTPFDAGIVARLHEVLGITIRYETMDSGAYFSRLASDPPAMWSLGWSADYPGPNDFLGLLLGTGQPNNYGHWSSPAFDKAIALATGTRDPATATADFATAETIVQSDAPVIPLSYDSGWALSRPGLLGAGDSGLGFVRFAGLAWAP